MVNTKLILVEGLPGSGKSTTAQLINEILKERNIPSILFLEGDLDHPADYDAVSYFTKEQFENLIEEFPDVRHQLEKHAVARLEGVIIPQRLLYEIPDALTQVLSQHDIYELPMDLHIQLLTDNWQRFCNEALNANETYILECCFIQNPVTIGMIKYGLPDKIVIQYIQQLAKIIEPLNPMLIYVDQADIRKSFLKAYHERSKAWADFFISYYTEQEYGKQIHAEGLEGTLEVLEARQKLEKNIYEQLKMNKTTLDNSDFSLDEYKKKIASLF